MPSARALGFAVILTAATLGALPSFDSLPATLTAGGLSSPAQPTTVTALADDAAIERFLKEAKVVGTRRIGKGVTGALRATLSDGTTTHDAQVQTVDESQREFRSASGIEFDFRDSWAFNVAAYRLDRLLGLRLVPVAVERRWRNQPAAFSWWIDDVMMDEGQRLKQSLQPPVTLAWAEEMQLVRLFDQLIFNVDRNLGNLVITKSWQIWAIDHTRAFRSSSALRSPADVARCDRQVLARLKALDRDAVTLALRGLIDRGRIDALLRRRDAIVRLVETKGAAGLFDRRRSNR